PGAHRGLDRPTHRPAEGDAPGQLLRHALGQERGVGLRPELARRRVHVLDLHVDALPGDSLDVLADAIDLGALSPDDDAGSRRADEHPDLVALSLDIDAGDPRPRQTPADVLADPDVLVEGVGVVASSVPVRLPRVDDPQPKAVRINLVAHQASPPSVLTTSVMCDVRLR